MPRRLVAAALIVAIFSGAGYALTTDAPLIANIRGDAYTLLAGIMDPAAPTQNQPTSAHVPPVDARAPAPAAAGTHPVTPDQTDMAAHGPSVIGSGYSRAERDVVLTASVAGRIAEVDVADGANVRAGSVLLKLDDRLAREKLRRTGLELQSKRLDLDQAKLTLIQQREDAKRVRKLVEKGAAPRTQETDSNHELAQRKLDFKRAEAAVRLEMADYSAAKAGLKDYVLWAPFDGRVTDLTAQTGQMVQSDLDEALLRVFDPNSIIVEVDVDDHNLRDIKAGQAAKLVFDAWSAMEVPGTVMRISPLVSKERGTVRVAIALDASPAEIRPNMAVRATIITAPDPKPLSSNRKNSNEKTQ